MDKGKQLFDEIRQIMDQYRVEVPGQRRAWPSSIKERILQLSQLKISWSDIASEIGIPRQTLYQWNSDAKAAKKSFTELPVVATPTSMTEKPVPRSTTVTVVTARGHRIEGLGFKEATKILLELER